MNRRKGFFGAVASLSERGRASQELGEAGEACARSLLARHGVKDIEKIHTGWKVLFGVRDGQRVPLQAWPIEKVSGDFIGIKDGRKVLCECKSTDSDRISFSDFRPHQISALDRTVENQGISLVFVFIDSLPFLLSWPIDGFGPGCSLVLKRGTLLVQSR